MPVSLMTQFKEITSSFLLAVLFSLWPFIVEACDCVSPGPKASVDRADIVFSGKVLEINYLDKQEKQTLEPQVEVILSVDKTWKGSVIEIVSISTLDNQWSCKGFHFVQGERYLVFANADVNASARKKWVIDHTCNGTVPLSAAQNVLQFLNQSAQAK